MSLMVAIVFTGNILSAQDGKNLIILVKYKTQPMKETQTLTALKELKNFISNSRDFLAGAPEITFWRILK